MMQRGDAGWDDGIGWMLGREDVDLVNVLMVLLEMDVSEKELDRLLGRVKAIYPQVRAAPPGWDD